MRFFRHAITLALLVAAGTAAASRLDAIRNEKMLRVCIWPDYYGISWRNGKTGLLTGLDIELAHELGQDLGVAVEFVDSSFPTLADDLKQQRCDIAMFAVAVTPARQKLLAFSVPYLQSDVYAVTTRVNRRVRSWEDIDRPGTVVAVSAGTYHEPLMRQRLRYARLMVVTPPATREAEVESGRADVFMTDYPYGRTMLDKHDWARLLAPPRPWHPQSYAYAVAPQDQPWLDQVNRFVADIKRDGRLAAAARQHGLSAIVLLR